MSDMDGLVAWLGGVLDEIERVADLAATATEREPWRVDGDYRVGAPWGDVVESWAGRGILPHVALNDPRAVLARVEAERAIVALYSKDWAGELANRLDQAGVRHPVIEQLAVGSVQSVIVPTLKALAYGHRFDAVGYRDEWKPDGTK